MNKEHKIIEILNKYSDKKLNGELVNLSDMDFEDAAKDVVKLFDIPVVMNWVACKYEIPISGKFYMTWDGFRIELTYKYDNNKFFTNEREVTHWQELPEPPCL